MALSSKIAFFYKLSDEVEEVSGASLTNNGTTTFTTGKIGNGAAGNGTNQSLSGALSLANVPSTEWHRWCWVNVDNPLDGSSGTPLFAAFAKWDGGGDWIFTIWADGHIDFSNLSGGVNSSALLSANTWHLIHGWWDGANYNVQIDNNTPDSNPGSTPGTNASAVSILAQGGGFSSYMPGIVDAAGGSNVAWDAGDYAELWGGGAGYEFTYTPPSVTLSVDNASISENGGVAVVTATLASTATREATVELSLSGTATGGGVDYTIDTTTLTIPVGQTTAAATVTAIDNAVTEASKTVIVDILSTTNATESGTQQVTITITDDEVSSSLTIAAFCEDHTQMEEFQLNQSSRPITFPMRHSSTGMLVTGLSPTVRLSKNGGAFAAAAGATGEMTLGSYSIAPSATDFNTGGSLKLIATAANCLPTYKEMVVVNHSPITGFPTGAVGAANGALVGSGTGTVVLTTGGAAYSVDATGANVATAASIPTLAGIASTVAAAITADHGSGNYATATALATAQTSIDTLATTSQLASSSATLLAAIPSVSALATTSQLAASSAVLLGAIPTLAGIASTVATAVPTNASIAATVAAVITADHGSGAYTTANVSALATSTALATAQTSLNTIAAKTNNLPASPASTSDIPSAVAIAAAVGSATTANTGLSRDRVLEAIAGACCSIITGAGTATNVVKHFNATTANLTITVDSDGNRSAVTIS